MHLWLGKWDCKDKSRQHGIHKRLGQIIKAWILFDLINSIRTKVETRSKLAKRGLDHKWTLTHQMTITHCNLSQFVTRYLIVIAIQKSNSKILDQPTEATILKLKWYNLLNKIILFRIKMAEDTWPHIMIPVWINQALQWLIWIKTANLKVL